MGGIQGQVAQRGSRKVGRAAESLLPEPTDLLAGRRDLAGSRAPQEPRGDAAWMPRPRRGSDAGKGLDVRRAGISPGQKAERVRQAEAPMICLWLAGSERPGTLRIGLQSLLSTRPPRPSFQRATGCLRGLNSLLVLVLGKKGQRGDRRGERETVTHCEG